MNEITAYQCEHCHKKIVRTAQAMKKHEAKCFHNPATKSCVACIFFEEGLKESLVGKDGRKPRNCRKDVNISSNLKNGCNLFEPIYNMENQ